MNSTQRTRERVSDTRLIIVSSILGISACLGDLAMTHLLGTWYPGYNPFLQPMSDLGDGGSPVARLTSNWWIIMGLMFVVFGYGFYRTFSHQGKPIRTAAWMIAVYGLGEGLGSGLVPGTPGNDFWTPNSIVHNLFGGLGVLAVVSLPFFMMKVFNAHEAPYLYWYSWFTTVTGISFFLLFSISRLFQPEAGWITYQGLWQRLFMLMYYLFLICLAMLMMSRRKTASI